MLGKIRGASPQTSCTLTLGPFRGIRWCFRSGTFRSGPFRSGKYGGPNMAWLRRSIFAALRGSRFALRCTLRPEDGFQVLRPTRSGVGGRSFSNPLHVAPPVFRSEATEWVPEDDVVPIPKYTPRVGEEDGRKRARLLYQSRLTPESGFLFCLAMSPKCTWW